VPAGSSGLAQRISRSPVRSTDRSWSVPTPVGEQRQLHVMHDAVAMEAVVACVGDKPPTARACSSVVPPRRSAAANRAPPAREIMTEKRLSAV
jgi:hypothetical protein